MPLLPPVIDPPWTLAASGQVRERFESVRSPGFGLAGDADDSYLLDRLTLNLEARDADAAALVASFISGSGIDAAELPPTQRDDIDVLQLYAEGSLNAGASRLRLRLGRQQLGLGASRLVSVRDSTNVRRALDGLRTTWFIDGEQLDAFYLRPVAPRPGAFDDASSAGQSLWGVYFTHAPERDAADSFELYYLGYRQVAAKYGGRMATEDRQSFGARVAGSSAGNSWNLEAVAQVGRFGESHIRAWTLSSDLGHAFSVPGNLRIGLKADAISGDRDPADGQLNTFNPLFPRLAYFSDANVAAPANLLDVQPNVSVALPGKLRLTGGWNDLWRMATHDAFYLPPLKPVRLAPDAGRHVGEQWSSTLEWQASGNIALTASFVHFTPGSALRAAGGSSGHFLGAWIQLDL
jgi:hypothetical protein